MAKHTKAELKYHYIIKYLNGESRKNIMLKMISDPNIQFETISAASSSLDRWLGKYYSNSSLISQSGKQKNPNKGRQKKKPEVNYDEMTREELIKEIEIWKDINEALDKIQRDIDEKKACYKIIDDLRSKYSVKFLSAKLQVSKSGYYNWVKNNKPLFRKYNKDLLNKIEIIYIKQFRCLGFRRIKERLEFEHGIYVNKETVRRYMLHLGIKAEIRQKKKSLEVKNTNVKFENIINRQFNSRERYRKLFTDVSYIQLKDKWAYCSVIIDGFNNEIIDIKLSLRNDTELVKQNIVSSIERIKNNNAILHSDHGYQYSSNQVIKILKENNIIQSMSRIGNSLDNRPAEYFFSILKHEYLRLIPIKNRTLENTSRAINVAKEHYNKERLQSKLNKKTPHEYAMSG